MSLTVNKVLVMEAIEGFIPAWILEARNNVNSLSPDSNGDVVIDDPVLEARLENLMKRNPAVSARVKAKADKQSFMECVEKLLDMVREADSFNNLDTVPSGFTEVMFNKLKKGK